MAKTYKKIEIEEIKTYKCSDGKIFNAKEEAEKHEEILTNPDRRIEMLEERIQDLERLVDSLQNKVLALEFHRLNPAKPHPDIVGPQWPPYPYNEPLRFDEEAKKVKLPAEPGNIMFYADPIETSKLSDEELMKKGYRVSYCGDKRCVLPPFENPLDKKVEINIDSVRGNATTPPEYVGNPLDNQDCGPNYNNSNIN